MDSARAAGCSRSRGFAPQGRSTRRSRRSRALASRYPDLRYAVVGTGEELEALAEEARQLGVGDRVRFLTDVPDRDLPALYNVAEVYLGVSRLMEQRVEGFGISLAEASACGVPVVAGRSGGIPAAVRDGETGLLVDAERPEAVAEALGRLLDDRGAARAARRGRAPRGREPLQLGPGHPRSRRASAGSWARPPSRPPVMPSAPGHAAIEEYDRQYQVWVERQGPRALDLDWRLTHLALAAAGAAPPLPARRQAGARLRLHGRGLHAPAPAAGRRGGGVRHLTGRDRAGQAFRGAAARPVFTTVPPGPGQFDLIYCNEALEHVADDSALVGELVGYLAPGGSVVGTTPFGD